ncbi:MAG TPA: hypothetical protein VGH54_28145 [Mycobacterium sp.]|uniref:hypothetical protein n=1 Tax=Mycobacterium sp. TaxID=1785 RepID=UPI002F3F3C5C
MDEDGGGKGVLLAISILLIWLAGVLLWVAFEGTAVLPVKLPVGPDGKPSYALGVVQAVTGQAQELQRTGVEQQQQQQVLAEGG